MKFHRLYWGNYNNLGCGRKTFDAWPDIAPRMENLGLEAKLLDLTKDELIFDIISRSELNVFYGISWHRKNQQSDLIRDLNWAMGELNQREIETCLGSRSPHFNICACPEL